MKKLLMPLTLGLLLACLAGCQDSVNTVENENKTMTVNTIADRRFVTDGFLRDRLKLTAVNTSESPDGFMRVQLTAVNVRVGVLDQAWTGLTGDNPYRIQYRFSWFDQNGMAVDSILSTWRQIPVIPGETVHLQSVAPTRECKDFMVHLKEAP